MLTSLEQLYLVSFLSPRLPKALRVCVVSVRLLYSLVSVGFVCVMCDFFFLLIPTCLSML